MDWIVGNKDRAKFYSKLRQRKLIFVIRLHNFYLVLLIGLIDVSLKMHMRMG
jgi:hypothetical protein